MAGFSLALGVGTVTVPLLALDAGYDPATVGFLAALAAATQLTTRFGLPWLLGRFRDRTLVTVSSLMMVGAFALLLGSRALPVFVAAQLLHGGARAIFWTSSQTHAVRGPGDRVRRLVDLNVAGGTGTLIGPAVAGTIAIVSLPWPSWPRSSAASRRPSSAAGSGRSSRSIGAARPARSVSCVATASTCRAGRAPLAASGGR